MYTIEVFCEGVPIVYIWLDNTTDYSQLIEGTNLMEIEIERIKEN